MKLNRTYFSLITFVFGSLLIYACQQQPTYERRIATGSARVDDGDKSEDQTGEEETNDEENGEEETPVEGFTMAWDNSGDAAIVSYKVFLVPPDVTAAGAPSRGQNASGIPIEVKNYPVAGLTDEGGKYSVTVKDEEIKAVLETLVLEQAQYCSLS